MKQRTPKIDPQRWELLQTDAKRDQGLVGALARSVTMHSLYNPLDLLREPLTQLYGKQPTEIKAEEFFCPALKQAFCTLAGAELTEQVPELLVLCREGPFSTSPWRRSYRSQYFSFYAPQMIELLSSLIGLSCYQGTVEDWLYSGEPAPRSYGYLLALEIRRGREDLIRLLWEALMGDNSQLLLTREIIQAVVISGHDGLMDALIKRLLAAGLQEGVRQQILEAADQGTVQVLTRILKVCLEHNLFRYSSTIRAFDTWTGLEYDNSKPEQVRQYGQLAYECLTDASRRQEYLEKGSPIQAYFALWGQGCLEVQDTYPMVAQLLQDPHRDRKIVGWLFVSRTDQNRYRMAVASQHLEERDPELLAWVIWNLAQTWKLRRTSWNIWARQEAGKSVPNPDLPSCKEKRVELFFRLKETAQGIGSKKQTFRGTPFPFVRVTLESERVYGCMLSLAGYDMDEDLVAELLTLAPKMPADLRQSLVCCFLLPEEKESHRAFLRSCLKDRSVSVKELAVQRLAECQLTQEDVCLLAESLRTQSSSLRAAIVAVLGQQTPTLLGPLLPKMLTSEEEHQNQVAMELILKEREANPAWFSDNRPFLERLRAHKLSPQTQILLDQLLPSQPEEPMDSPETGYGLYDPQVVEAYLSSLEAQKFKQNHPEGQENLLTREELQAALPTWEELKPLLDRLEGVFTRHGAEEMEVLTGDGSRCKVLFGDSSPHLPLPAACGCASMGEPGARLEMIPFWDEFYQALGEYTRESRKMLGLFYLCTRLEEPVRMFGRDLYRKWVLPAAKEHSIPHLVDKCVSNYPRMGQMLDIMEHLPQLFDHKTLLYEIIRCYQSVIGLLEEERPAANGSKQQGPIIVYGNPVQDLSMNHATLVALRRVIRQLELPSDAFAEWFSLEYALEQPVGGWVLVGLCVTDYFRAYQEGLIPRDVLVAFLLRDTAQAKEAIRVLTHPVRWAEGRKIYERYPLAKPLISQLLDRIVTVEARRGELPTPLTGHCLAIQRFYGMEHVCRLLAALGKERFFRGYEYAKNTTKQVVLSRLLKRCYPRPEDTPEGFAALVKTANLPEKRLVEAVMYAPQWADFVEAVLGWPGLASGVWFFHAHINETFSAEKETEVARYSPIPPQRFYDGVFDRNWFLKAYGQLGERRFGLLYQSAKYITSNNSLHRRSRLYADAALGKMDASTLSEEILQTRDQEKLRCYPLLPMAGGDRQEPLRRYEFIQKFRKESRQFGAQRRSSEEKACAIALENLANTLGLADVHRLVWQMESRKMEQIRPFLEPIQVGDVSIRLTIDEQGDAALVLEQGGKGRKTVPKVLAKEERYRDRKELVRELKELKRRARESLERAMVGCASFQREELEALWEHPVLAPMLRTLVWTDGAHNGFLRQWEQGLRLEMLDGTCLPADCLRIAHPHDLRTAGDWTDYMHLLYEKQLIQPFKQVFREYYPITAEERQERTISRRYAGHQVQPRRTLALLKQHGWTVDREEGLQKIFYAQNLMVRIYAMADWFSPAEIEAPTLETVEFFDRTTGGALPLEQVPPILFSETMRDLDLVVSVAHVGGVDPETSHSTVELRMALARELVRLFQLPNVSWVGSHAKIHGQLANYSLHMGSGIVHAEGIGMLTILPVHSQARGRIFLPFADDDPKTAEILSKILLLAQDKTIKDPAILRQLT